MIYQQCRAYVLRPWDPQRTECEAEKRSHMADLEQRRAASRDWVLKRSAIAARGRSMPKLWKAAAAIG